MFTRIVVAVDGRRGGGDAIDLASRLVVGDDTVASVHSSTCAVAVAPAQNAA